MGDDENGLAFGVEFAIGVFVQDVFGFKVIGQVFSDVISDALGVVDDVANGSVKQVLNQLAGGLGIGSGIVHAVLEVNKGVVFVNCVIPHVWRSLFV